MSSDDKSRTFITKSRSGHYTTTVKSADGRTEKRGKLADLGRARLAVPELKFNLKHGDKK